MSNLTRIRELAGLSTTEQVISELESSRQAITEAHNSAIKQAKAGLRIDEGLFSTLIAALSTAGQASLLGTKAIVDKAKKLAEPIKQLYLDNKAKAELKELATKTEEVAKNFEEMEKEASTLIKRDKDIATSINAFKAALQDFIGKLTVRGSVVQATESQVQITELNVSQLFEEFYAPSNKVAWIKKHMAGVDFTEHREMIIHALASRMSNADLRKLRDDTIGAPDDSKKVQQPLKFR